MTLSRTYMRTQIYFNICRETWSMRLGIMTPVTMFNYNYGEKTHVTMQFLPLFLVYWLAHWERFAAPLFFLCALDFLPVAVGLLEVGHGPGFIRSTAASHEPVGRLPWAGSGSRASVWRPLHALEIQITMKHGSQCSSFNYSWKLILSVILKWRRSDEGTYTGKHICFKLGFFLFLGHVCSIVLGLSFDCVRFNKPGQLNRTRLNVFGLIDQFTCLINCLYYFSNSVLLTCLKWVRR